MGIHHHSYNHSYNQVLCTEAVVWSPLSWWRHQMGTFAALLAICAGNSPVNSPHKGQWRGAFMFSLICVWINGWVNNREAGDLRRYRAHYDVTLMIINPDYLDSRNARQSAEPAMNTQNQVGFPTTYLVISKFESFFVHHLCDLVRQGQVFVHGHFVCK